MVTNEDLDEVVALLVQVMNDRRYSGIDSVMVVNLAFQLAALRQQAQANMSLKEIASCVTARHNGEEHVILTG